MSFFLLTLLSGTGVFGGILGLRQITWKHSHLHQWLRERAERKDQIRMNRAEHNRVYLNLAKERDLKKKDKTQAEEFQAELYKQKALAARGITRTIGPDQVESQSRAVSGLIDMANSLSGHANVTGTTIHGNSGERNLRAEIYEENRRREYVKRHGNTLGYIPLDLTPPMAVSVTYVPPTVSGIYIPMDYPNAQAQERFRARVISETNPPIFSQIPHSPPHRINRLDQIEQEESSIFQDKDLKNVLLMEMVSKTDEASVYHVNTLREVEKAVVDQEGPVSDLEGDQGASSDY